jgi:hypothetical protein
MGFEEVLRKQMTAETVVHIAHEVNRDPDALPSLTSNATAKARRHEGEPLLRGFASSWLASFADSAAATAPARAEVPGSEK